MGTVRSKLRQPAKLLRSLPGRHVERDLHSARCDHREFLGILRWIQYMEDTIHARPNRPLGIRCEFLGRRAGWKRGLRMRSRRYSRNAQPGRVESALVWFQGRKTYSTPELPRGRSIFCEELEHDEPHCLFKLGASPRLQHAF